MSLIILETIRYKKVTKKSKDLVLSLSLIPHFKNPKAPLYPTFAANST
jgi:hypothetical protein